MSRSTTSTSFLTILLSLLLVLAPFVCAAPIPSRVELEERAAYNPQIETPSAGEVYRAGGDLTVKWDESDAPNDGRKGKIVLGYLEGDDLNEHLDLANPLADKVNYSTGSLTVKLPTDLPTRSRYIIVFFGNSGNASEEFTILAADDTSSASAMGAAAATPASSGSVAEATTSA